MHGHTCTCYAPKQSKIRVSSMALLRVEKQNGIATVSLNRPEKRNAMSFALLNELVKAGQSLFQKAFLIWQELPVPVIAALEGFCFGAGMQLALAADIRIAHPETQMSIMESRWG